jgi:hypothetical protein
MVSEYTAGVDEGTRIFDTSDCMLAASVVCSQADDKDWLTGSAFYACRASGVRQVPIYTLGSRQDTILPNSV